MKADFTPSAVTFGSVGFAEIIKDITPLLSLLTMALGSIPALIQLVKLLKNKQENGTKSKHEK